MKKVSASVISLGEYSLLTRLAYEDNHHVMYPTHVLKKNKEIVGYASINATPVLNMWMSSRLHVMDSYRVFTEVEQLAVKDPRYVGSVVLLCDPKSPLAKFVPRLGYKCIGNTNLNLKLL